MIWFFTLFIYTLTVIASYKCLTFVELLRCRKINKYNRPGIIFLSMIPVFNISAAIVSWAVFGIDRLSKAQWYLVNIKQIKIKVTSWVRWFEELGVPDDYIGED